MKKYAFWFVCLLLLGWLTLFSFQKIDLSTADIGRHIQNGNIFLHAAQYGVSRADLLYTNFFSYTYPSFPFINHHWGSGILFYLIYIASGFSGLSLFYFLCIAAAFYLMIFAVREVKNSVSVWQDLPTLLLTALFLAPLVGSRVEVRPEGLSFLFLALFFFLLFRFSRDRSQNKNQNSRRRKFLYFIPLVEMLWVNTHIFFIFGVYIVGIFFFESLILRRWQKAKTLAKVLSLTALATLVSPYFISGAIYPFLIFRNYGYRIVENQSIPFLEHLSFADPNFLWYKLTLALIILSSIFVFWKARRNSSQNLESTSESASEKFLLAPTALALTFATLGFFGIRFIATFALFSLSVLICNFSALKKWLSEKLAGIGNDLKIILVGGLFCLVVFGGLWQFSSRLPWNRDFGLGLQSGELDSVNFIKENGIHGPIFNNYDIGGMIIFALWPQEKVFVDNRPETYPASFFSDIYIPMQQDSAVWQSELQKENFNVIYFQRLDMTPWAQQFLVARVSDQAWAPVYVDSYTIIFLRRNEQNAELIKKFELPKSMFSVK